MKTSQAKESDAFAGFGCCLSFVRNDPVGKSFYEVLAVKPIALFIQHKGNLLTAGKPVGYGGTSQVASANLKILSDS